MADYTKFYFSFNGKKYDNNGQGFPKNRLILNIVEHYVRNHPNITYNKLEDIFPPKLQGGYGVFKKIFSISEKHKQKRFFAKDEDIIRLQDGSKIAVSSEWGTSDANNNFQKFISHATNKLGYEIKPINYFQDDNFSYPEPEKPKFIVRKREKSLISEFLTFPLNTIFYGPPGTGKTYNTILRAVEIIENRKIENYDEALDIFKNKLHNQIEFITFHQNYSYEDFIQGLRPVVENNSALVFEKKDGIFKQIADRASNNLEQKYVIVIDEINRANISRVFGELITLIEPDKRSGGAISLEVKLPSGDLFSIPSNLFIIGTMNTADKSIALLDIALRRRFEFEAFYPKYHSFFNNNYAGILQKMNNKIIELKGYDFQIGHSYFMNLKDNVEFKKQMNTKIIPLLLEYFMNDKEEVISILESAGLFVKTDSWPLKIRM